MSIPTSVVQIRGQLHPEFEQILTPEALAEAAAYAPELQARYDPARIGLATAIAIEALGVQRA